MHPLVLIVLVLLTALLWFVFTLVMLGRLDRVRRRALRRERKASRIKTRPKVPADIPAETGHARRHLLKGWRHHTSAPWRAWHG